MTECLACYGSGRCRACAGKGNWEKEGFRGGDLAMCRTGDGRHVVVRIDAINVQTKKGRHAIQPVGLYLVQELSQLGKEIGRFLVDPESLSEYITHR